MTPPTAGFLWVADTLNHVVRGVWLNGTPLPVAGTVGVAGRDDGDPALCTFSSPRGLAFDACGSLLLADSGNYRVRKIFPNGTIALVAGSGIGSAACAAPWLDGSWATRAGLSLVKMPFDAVLLGSRVMVAREAVTAPEVKALSRKNDIRPFEDAASLEFLCDKNECAAFLISSQLAAALALSSSARLHRRIFGSGRPLPHETGAANASAGQPATLLDVVVDLWFDVHKRLAAFCSSATAASSCAPPLPNA
jgi:hypothetical protein